jgi:hypothetical protein
MFRVTVVLAWRVVQLSVGGRSQQLVQLSE